MYRVLNTLARRYNQDFTVLSLPTAISVDTDRRVLVLPHYDGDDLAMRWDESDGGASLGINLASTIPAVLEDLARIDPTPVVTDPILSTIPGLVFDHHRAIGRTARIARRLLRGGLVSQRVCANAERVLSHEQRSPMIVNNGDFYPRNMIVRPTGRVVVVDWETYNANSPFHSVDHLENVAAVFYVHMWGNPAWQAAYRAALDARFGLADIDFSKGLVIQALELADMWIGDEATRDLAAVQADLVTDALT